MQQIEYTLLQNTQYIEYTKYRMQNIHYRILKTQQNLVFRFTDFQKTENKKQNKGGGLNTWIRVQGLRHVHEITVNINNKI